MDDANDRNFVLRPTPGQKFRPKAVNGVVQEILHEKLNGLEHYSMEESEKLTNEISVLIRDRLKVLQLPRYKYIVQTMITEQIGHGATTALQCCWDEDCDSYVHQRFVTGSIWCEVLVFAIFHY
uniref:Dynein light chain n=1 Tax=Caenorhabditis japonica TaxID=281687 RepID=A0A8R1HQM6_CAEJA